MNNKLMWSGIRAEEIKTDLRMEETVLSPKQVSHIIIEHKFPPKVPNETILKH